MTSLLRTKRALREGEVLNKWLDSRLIRRNQNILLAMTGGTGSGKSYTCLRICELWYDHHFDKPFEIKNICFSIAEVMRLLSSGNLKTGELIVLEEAGVNLGSLDFQNKVSKLFTYVLQSFRSMNVGVLFNLPVLTMMNKSARLLVHSHMITSGIDYQAKQIKLKAFYHQLNQQTGKVYPKYMRIRVGGSVVKVSRFVYNLPSQHLIDEYETKKLKFGSELSESFSRELDDMEKDHLRKMGRSDLTERQRRVYELLNEGLNVKEIAEKEGVSIDTIYDRVTAIKKKGLGIKKGENA